MKQKRVLQQLGMMLLSKLVLDKTLTRCLFQLQAFISLLFFNLDRNPHSCASHIL